MNRCSSVNLRPVALMSPNRPCYSPPTSKYSHNHLELMTFLEITLSAPLYSAPLFAPQWENQA